MLGTGNGKITSNLFYPMVPDLRDTMHNTTDNFTSRNVTISKPVSNDETVEAGAEWEARRIAVPVVNTANVCWPLFIPTDIKISPLVQILIVKTADITHTCLLDSLSTNKVKQYRCQVWGVPQPSTMATEYSCTASEQIPVFDIQRTVHRDIFL
jgi:hypothetical protein